MSFKNQEQEKIQLDIHRLIMARDSRYTNFIEYLNYKIVYKRYAGLYFILCIDYNDNELSYLEFIQLFVEILNDYFGNVSEMNLIYQFHEIY